MKSKKKVVFLGALILCGAVALLGRSCTPEAELAEYLGELSDIMSSNMKTPAEGATEVFDYLQDELPDMLFYVGKIYAALDELEDPGDRKKRGDEIVAVLRPALKRFNETHARFVDRVNGDPGARKVVKERLSRLEPLEGLLGGLTGALRLP